MRSVSARYEQGVFRPIEPVELTEGAEVQILLDGVMTDEEAVALLHNRWPGLFGGFPQEAAQEMMQAIEEEFEQIEPNAWK